MKNSVKQRNSAESIASAIQQITEMAINSGKSIVRSVNWITESKSYLRKIADATAQLTSIKNNAHPMLEVATSASFKATADAAEKVIKLVSDTTLQKALDFAHNCENNILQISSYLKQDLEELTNLYENFVSDISYPICNTIRECSAAGYVSHCGYLRYANALDELEKSFNNYFADIKDIDDRLVTFESGFMKNTNGFFINNFPHAAAKPNVPTMLKHDDAYNKIMRTFRIGFQGFRTPYKAPVYAAQFDFPTLTMRALINFNSSKVGEIALQQGDKVEVINSSYAEFLKVRTKNGMEGFVPYFVLEPCSK